MTTPTVALPDPRKTTGLRRRLMVFTALGVLLPVLLSGGAAVFTFRRSLVGLSLREQAEAARRLAERVSASVDNIRKVLQTVGTQNLHEEPEPAAAPAPPSAAPKAGAGRKARPRARPKPKPRRNRTVEDALRRLLKNYPVLMDAALVGPDARERVKLVRRGSTLIVSKDLADRSDRAEVMRALAGRSMAGPVFFTVRDHYPQMFVSAPAGKGALLCRVSLDGLSDLLLEAPGADGGGVYVVDAGGSLIAHPERKRVLKHGSHAGEPIVREFVAAGEAFVDGGRVMRDRDGRRTLIAAHKTPGLNWLVVVQTPFKDAMGPLFEAGRRAGAAVGTVGAIFLVGGLILAYRILKPLRLLQEGVQEIAQGNLSHRIDVRTNDEIQRLADEFNAMAGTLERLEQTKRDLTHMIVHDLKSPLASVLGSLDYVLMAAKDLSPEHKKLLSLGSKAGKDQLRMIQNLLDLGKMEEGKLELKRETFPLLELAAQCIDDLEANMHREGKMMSVDIPKDLPKVSADRDLLHRVLSNLLTNALKHTAHGAEIAIGAETADEGRAVVLTVKDNGEGIPAEYLGKIFEKFGQADMRKQNFRVGSGLGLTFCKLAVESHGGKIWVESEVGKGSTFFVQLPLGETPEAVAFPDAKLTAPRKP